MRNQIINLEFTLKEYKQEISILKEEIQDRKAKMDYLVKSLEEARLKENSLKDQIYMKRSHVTQSNLRNSLLNSTELSHMSKKDNNNTLPTNLSNDYVNTSRLSMEYRRGEYNDVDLDEFQRELMEEDFD